MDKVLFVAIGGVSGSGKSVLTDNLVKEFPDVYAKATQVTTRKQREGEGDTYDFIRDCTYDVLKDSLIAKTQIKDSRYGTIVPSGDSHIQIVIINELGLLNLHSDLDKIDNAELACTIILDRDYSAEGEELPAGREDRVDALHKEREIIQYADILWDCTGNRFPTANDIHELLTSYIK